MPVLLACARACTRVQVSIVIYCKLRVYRSFWLIMRLQLSGHARERIYRF